MRSNMYSPVCRSIFAEGHRWYFASLLKLGSDGFLVDNPVESAILQEVQLIRKWRCFDIVAVSSHFSCLLGLI